ncbi:nuclease-related domain-containing protein [Alkaliphilus transvaalensis]|uniref:nuclease-related domain-containing protein n=1 Tax=Alkaliphilus transvaalensis TaxID=114628 RepID=UPI000478FB6D|nr:nuclease-related domain-containing protein [Alkaliphilus transvaalensis]
MAVVKGYQSICKYTYYKELFKNPFWIFLISICLIGFLAANSLHTYLAAGGVLLICLCIIAYAYFGEELQLHNRVFRKLSKLDHNFILLPYLKISDGFVQTCTSFILISPKGIFNIKLLDFSGILTGTEDAEVWDFDDAYNAYNIHRKKVKNPLKKLRQSQEVIEKLLDKNHINYLFLRSIFVVKNSNATFSCDTDVPVVRLKDLNEYIMGYADRPNMITLKDDVASSILKGHLGSCCLKMFCPE